MTARCCNCGGPWHEATGHVLGAERPTVLCGPCAGRYFGWVLGHTRKKASKRQRRDGDVVSFYQAAATSIKPEAA
jgi:hypothetical protein